MPDTVLVMPDNEFFEEALFSFRELPTQEAKENAREWFRENMLDIELDTIQEDMVIWLKERFNLVTENIFWTDPYSQGYCVSLGRNTYLNLKNERDILYILYNKEELKRLELLELIYGCEVEVDIQEISGDSMGVTTTVEIVIGDENLSEEQEEELYSKLVEELLEDIDIRLEEYVKDILKKVKDKVRDMIGELLFEDYVVDQILSDNEQWLFDIYGDKAN